jgi:hypothetical protein
MSLKIEKFDYIVNENENSITLGWIQNTFGVSQFQAETFDWRPNDLFFRLFVAKDPVIFAKKTVAEKELELQRKFLRFHVDPEVDSPLTVVKNAIIRIASAIFSKIQKAVKNFFKKPKPPQVEQPKPLFPKAPICYSDKVQQKEELSESDHRIVCYISDEWEADAYSSSSSVKRTDMSLIDSQKEQIEAQIKRNARLLYRIIKASTSNVDFASYAEFQANKNLDFLNNNISDPKEFLDSLHEMRNELDLLLRKRPEELHDKLASLLPEWKASLEAFNKLIHALEY